ncbi:MAG: alpha/beta fold hydrolase [Nitrososphaerales archaeon]
MKQDFVEVNGYRVRFLEDGFSKSNHVLFLHGLGASAERWGRVVPIFAKYFHVVAPDIIGFGYSDKPEVNYTISFFLDFVMGFVSALGMEHLNLIGSSLGGHIAAELAITSKNRIEKLVLVTPAGIMKESTPVLNHYIAAAMYPTFDNAKKAFEQMAGNPNAVDIVYAKDFVNRMQLPNAKYTFMSAIMGSKAAPNLSGRLKWIEAPTLILWGEKDGMIPVRYAGNFQSKIKGSQLAIIKGSGHTPYFEKPEAFSDTVLEFLRKSKK